MGALCIMECKEARLRLIISSLVQTQPYFQLSLHSNKSQKRRVLTEVRIFQVTLYFGIVIIIVYPWSTEEFLIPP